MASAPGAMPPMPPSGTAGAVSVRTGESKHERTASDGSVASDNSDGWAQRDKASDCSVRVVVRVRPFVPREKVEGCQDCTRIVDSRELVVGNKRRFTYDRVYDQGSQQARVSAICCAVRD